MKIQTTLALLVASLWCSVLYAQPATRMQERARHLQSMAASVRHLPAAFAAPVSERGGAPKLDSTVTFVYLNNDSFPNLKTTFEEPANNISVSTTFRMFDEWARESRNTSIGDDLGRTINVLGEIWDADQGLWLPESLLEVFPHGNSMTLQDSMFVYAWDTDINDWKIYISIRTSYDNQDRPVESVTFFNLEIIGEFTIRDEMFYDNNGDNHLTIQSALDFDVWTPFSRIETIYQQHRPINETTFYYIDDVNYLPSTQVNSEYDPNGHLILTVLWEFDFDANDWVNTQTTQYTVDNAGRILTQVNDDLDPENPLRTQVAYAYFSGLDLFSEANSTWDFNAGVWILNEKTYYYYANTTSAPVAIGVEKLIFSPNPTTGLVNLSVPQQARLSVLDAQGRSVSPDRLGDQALNFGHLPAGVYYIQVSEGDKASVGTVVKQ